MGGSLSLKPSHNNLFLILLLILFGFSSLFLSGLALPFRGALMTAFALCTYIAIASILFAHSRDDLPYLLFVGFILLYWVVAFPPGINGNDDNTAYLVFAREFYASADASLQGLSERRMLNLGGGYVFQAPIIHWLGYRALGLVEPVLGLLLSFAVLSVFVADRAAKYVAAAIVGCVPLLASHLLGNTAPVFIMSAVLLLVLFAFASAVIEEPSTASVGLIWIGAAYLCQLRPTMAVFVALILLANLCMIRDLRMLRINAAWALCALLVFVASAAPYAAVYKTLLYPVLGRGIHVSSTGLTVNHGIPLAEVLRNLAVFVLKERFLLPLSLLTALALWFDRRNARLYLILYAAYAINAVILVYSTGGLADSRYAMPVSIPLCMVLCAAAIPPLVDMLPPRIALWRHALSLVLILPAAAMLLLALRYAPQVAEIRYRMYEPDRDQKDMLARIAAYAAGHPESRILFLAAALEKYATPGLSGRYLIMDQPGMIDPSRALGLDYASWLRQVLDREKVGLIVSPDFACGTPMPEPKGWVGVSNHVLWKNQEALCSLRNSYDFQTVGPYLLMSRRAGGA